jgi:hypothetical protein
MFTSHTLVVSIQVKVEISVGVSEHTYPKPCPDQVQITPVPVLDGCSILHSNAIGLRRFKIKSSG